MVILCSCSVKENRSVCPCELLVRSEEALKTEGNVLVSVIQEGEVVRQGMLSREDFENGLCRLTVPRKPSTVTVFSGITSMSAVEGRSLDIIRSFQCDEVYSSSVFADLQGDSYDCVILPHKNYARLFLTVIGIPESAGLRIMGPVGGYDLMSMEPNAGDFDCRPDDGGADASFEVRLPRQKDDGLTLHVYYAEGSMRSVSLGPLIEASGYSFSDEDLLDISLTVDLANSYAMVRVQDWRTEDYKIVEF